MGHLVELGVVWVFHLDHPRFPPIDTGDGAHLHARGVREVDFGADEGVVGGIPNLVLFWGRGWPLWPGSACAGGGGVSCWGGDGSIR